MRSLSGRAFAHILERNGWHLLRVNGSHHIYGKPGTVVRLSVPIHASRPFKAGLLRHLAKQANIADEEMK